MCEHVSLDQIPDADKGIRTRRNRILTDILSKNGAQITAHIITISGHDAARIADRSLGIKPEQYANCTNPRQRSYVNTMETVTILYDLVPGFRVMPVAVIATKDMDSQKKPHTPTTIIITFEIKIDPSAAEKNMRAIDALFDDLSRLEKKAVQRLAEDLTRKKARVYHYDIMPGSGDVTTDTPYAVDVAAYIDRIYNANQTDDLNMFAMVWENTPVGWYATSRHRKEGASEGFVLCEPMADEDEEDYDDGTDDCGSDNNGETISILKKDGDRNDDRDDADCPAGRHDAL